MPAVMVRAGGDPLALVPSVRTAMAAADRSVAQAEVTTMDRLWSEHIGQDRVGAIVVALFAGFGLLLAGLGVYGVMAYSVRQREAEIGVRLALGAESRRILADVMSRAVSIAAVGLALGLAGAFASRRILSTMLVDVAPQEMSIVLASGGVLGLVALLAAVVPALRAVRIDPVVVLRR